MPFDQIKLENGFRAQVLDRRGKPYRRFTLLREWLEHDSIFGCLRVQGRSDWPFEAMMPTSPAHLTRVFRSAAKRNLELMESCQTEFDRLGKFPPRELPQGLSRIVRRMRKGIPVWQVGVLESNPFAFGPSKVRALFPRSGVLRADPFPIQHSGSSWILFEEMLTNDRGRFRAAQLESGEWTVREGELLDLPHHLSWPCPIKIDGKLFLLPETGEAEEVALWECLEFPHRWRKAKVLLTGRAWVDASLFKRDGTWWLFVSACGSDDQDHSAELQAFHSPDPLREPFQPHALNPLSVSVTGSRPAGIPFTKDGVWFRPVQDCRGGYGTGVILKRIEELSPTTWSETVLGCIEPPPGSVGIHTLNHLPEYGWIVDLSS